jgi:hypothetical protein
MNSHYKDRAAFMKEHRKLFRAFLGEVNDSFNKKDEDLEIEIAIAGSYAAHLHGKYYLQSALMAELEPIRRIDLRCIRGRGRPGSPQPRAANH